MSFNVKKIIVLVLLICVFALLPFLFRGCYKEGDMTLQQGFSLMSKKHQNEAIDCFKLALEQENSYGNELIDILIANCYSQLGNYDEAIEWRKKSQELVPDATNCAEIGILYRVKKDDATAEEMFKKALEIESENNFAMNNLASLYLTQNRIDEAIPLFEKSLETEKTEGIVYADLAICYARKGDFEKSEEYFASAEKLKTRDIENFRKEINELKAGSAN